MDGLRGYLGILLRGITDWNVEGVRTLFRVCRRRFGGVPSLVAVFIFLGLRL